MPASPSSTLPDARWLIGVEGALKHAVPRHEAALAMARQAEGRPWNVPKLCGGPAQLVAGWGAFENDNPRLAFNRCPTCRWAVAIERDAVQAELDAIAPSSSELPALTRLLDEPLMAVRICQAILASTSASDSEYERDHPHVAHLLGHATAHAPTLAIPEDCANQGCDHRPADRWDGPTWECDYPDADVACGTCSFRAGGYAGEWQDNFSPECFVPAPCSVLTTFAQHYDIALGSRRDRATPAHV
jgi:hypothetical protein